MRSLKILVVDDDRDNADSMGELFQLEGHDVRVVYSGREAIHAYLEADFNLAFIDVMMPGMNGVESYMEIRKLKPKANVFMMSGYSVEELLKQAMAQGAKGLLSKPVDPRTLLAATHEVGENGVLVAQCEGPHYIKELERAAAASEKRCRIVDSPGALERGGTTGDMLVLNMNQPLIDTIGLYATLRKAQDLPPTAIVAPWRPETVDGDSFTDMLVTGILSKPFDPDRVLTHVQAVAA
ncbi:MAG: response regulator [Alphaproteobacteria bacterium]|nr:response regulator [Alphaproteobacteria bacterium]